MCMTFCESSPPSSLACSHRLPAAAATTSSRAPRRRHPENCLQRQAAEASLKDQRDLCVHVRPSITQHVQRRRKSCVNHLSPPSPSLPPSPLPLLPPPVLGIATAASRRRSNSS